MHIYVRYIARGLHFSWLVLLNDAMAAATQPTSANEWNITTKMSRIENHKILPAQTTERKKKSHSNSYNKSFAFCIEKDRCVQYVRWAHAKKRRHIVAHTIFPRSAKFCNCIINWTFGPFIKSMKDSEFVPPPHECSSNFRFASRD